MRAFGSEDAPHLRGSARSSQMPQNANFLTEPTVNDTAESEYTAGYFSTPLAEMWGESSEPWQEFSSMPDPPRRAATESNRKSLSEYSDMETILLGGTRKEGAASASAPNPPDPVDEVIPKPADTSMKRSRSVVARLRRLKASPDEVGSGETPRRRGSASAAVTESTRGSNSGRSGSRSLRINRNLSLNEPTPADPWIPNRGGQYASAAGTSSQTPERPVRAVGTRESRATRMSERTPASAMLMAEPTVREAAPQTGSGSGMTRSKSFIGRLRSTRR